MKTRIEHIEITIKCDMIDCDSDCRYSDELGPYNDGWRTVVLRVYDKYTDRLETEVTKHYCGGCIEKLLNDEHDT